MSYGFWIGADIEARRNAGAIDDDAHRAQWVLRTDEKQKMLDRLFTEGLLRDGLPRKAADYPDLTGDLHNAVIGFLARTPSQLLAVNQEDLTKETAQQNLPGTTWQYPNWGRGSTYVHNSMPTKSGVNSSGIIVTRLRSGISKMPIGCPASTAHASTERPGPGAK
jgi:4-alpha-glucanotransferase